MAQEKRERGGPDGGPIKVVETMLVTDEELERIINEWHAKGYLLDGIHFAMHESSKRPAMAFLIFSKSR